MQQRLPNKKYNEHLNPNQFSQPSIQFQNINHLGTQINDHHKDVSTSNSNANTYETISQEYKQIKNKVQDRIRQLQNQINQDPSKTRVTNLHKQYNQMNYNNCNHNNNHATCSNVYGCACPNLQIQQNPHLLHRDHCYSTSSINLSRYRIPSNACSYVHSVPQQYQQVQTSLKQKIQLGSNSNGHIHQKSFPGLPLHSIPSQSSLPISNQIYSSRTGTVNQNISGISNGQSIPHINQIILQNLRTQKQISSHLKALSQKLSDFSASGGKRSQYSSGYAQQVKHSHNNQMQNKQASSYPHQMNGHYYQPVIQSSHNCYRFQNDYLHYQRMHGQNSHFRKKRLDPQEHTNCKQCKQMQVMNQRYKYPKQLNRYFTDHIQAHHRYPESSDSDHQQQNHQFKKHRHTHTSQSKANLDTDHRSNKSRNSRNSHKVCSHNIKNRQNTACNHDRHSNSKNISKRSNSLHGQARPKSVSIKHSGSSRSKQNKNRTNSTHKVYTFKVSKQQHDKANNINNQSSHDQGYLQGEYYGYKKSKRNHAHENSRSKNNKYLTQKNEHANHCCPLHSTNQVLQMYEKRQKNKRNRQIYKDSQHRNRKHEKQHMTQSFHQQQKLRKELIAKISKNFFNSYGVK